MSEKEYLAELSKRIIYARKKRGLTQEQLAEIAGVSHKVVQKLESGTNATRSHNLASIIRALDEDANYILFGDVSLGVRCGIFADYNEKINNLSTDQSLLLCTMIDTFFKTLESRSPFEDAEKQ